MINTTYIDQKYIRFLSGRLKNFRDKGNGSFEFSHSCERADSRKRRGYFYKKGNGYNFMCHNCQESTKFFTFLFKEDSMLSKDYKLEIFKESMSSRTESKDIADADIPKEPEEQKRIQIEGLEPYDQLLPTHPARKYLEKRQIPTEFWKDLYFCRDFFKWGAKFVPSFEKVTEKEPRLIIPYRDKNGEVFGFTCRAYGKSDRKYIEIKIDSDAEMIFGVDRIDKATTILAVEGPIDSLFLPNCVAVGGANYKSKFLEENKSNIIIIPDSDWRRNIDVLRKVEEAGRQGFRIALMPDTYKSKDVNDAILSGMSSSEITKIAKESAKSGAELLLDIAFRRKC